MKPLATVVATALTMLGLSVAAGTLAQGDSKAPPARTQDEAAIRALARGMQEGWNGRSGEVFAAPFAQDADYVVVNGMHVKGRPAIAAGHQRIFDTIYKDSTLTLQVSSIRFLREDVAVAHVGAELKVRRNEMPQTNISTIGLVATRDGGKWSVAAFQNTLRTGPPAER